MAAVSYYGILPASVRYNESLKPVEKLLYCEFTALCGTGGFCIVDMEYLARITGSKDTTILSYLDSLEKCRYIKTMKMSDDRIRVYIKDVYY